MHKMQSKVIHYNYQRKICKRFWYCYTTCRIYKILRVRSEVITVKMKLGCVQRT